MLSVIVSLAPSMIAIFDDKKTGIGMPPELGCCLTSTISLLLLLTAMAKGNTLLCPTTPGNEIEETSSIVSGSMRTILLPELT
jgi:hypothetical protein